MAGEYRLGRLNGRWVVTWWEGGKRQRYRLKASSRADAEREAIDKIREKTAPQTHRTVDDLWEAYRREKQGRRVASAMEFEWRAMKPHFGHLRPDQVSVDTCRSYTDKRRKAGKHDGTIWTELGHLRTVFRWAADSRLIDHAPKVERPPKPAPKDRYLTSEEIDRLLATPMAHHIKIAILLMLSTAARVGAILELRWSRVDFERGQIDLRSSDIGPRKGRAVVPMNDGLKAALQTAKAGALTDFVIEWAGEPVKSIKTGFNKAVKDAGLKKVTPHVLRHTAAVHLAAAGVSMSKISQYLGHTNTSVTERVYARFAPDHLRDEAAILDFTKTRQVQ
jgi:integrase